MRIFNTQVYGLEESIIRSGYPMAVKISEEIGDEVFELMDFDDDWTLDNNKQAVKRASKLGNTPAGSGHDCFLKGIIVQADFEAPGYWWPQAQRYHWFDFVSSQSKMHKITEMDLEKQCPGVHPVILDICKKNINLYKDGLITLEQLLGDMPQGLELTAGITTSYLQIKTMHSQRKTHKLVMWNQVFKEWVEGLPYSRELGVC
jgi:hypothetical protein